MWEVSVGIMPKSYIGKDDYYAYPHTTVRFRVKEVNKEAVFRRAHKVAFPELPFEETQLNIQTIEEI